MKKFTALLLCLLMMTGCHAEDGVDPALAFREKITSAQSCSFDCVITADYSDRLYSFQMQCSFDESGNLNFTVTEPESISGITGSISSTGGKLTFDDKALLFEQMADGYVSPVTAPWLFMKTLRSGYLASCSQHEDGFLVTIDDSYEEKPLLTEVWMDRELTPYRAELMWEGRRVLSLDVVNFEFL